MKKDFRTFLVAASMLLAPMAASAQSTYENIDAEEPVMLTDSLATANLSVNEEYQQWLRQYEQVGTDINEVSEQYQKEVDKRGYPKKKTIKKKIALVEQYVKLLQEEKDNPVLNQNLDVKKVERKIALWQSQLEGLNELYKKVSRVF